jgi:hypothetical protein
MLTQSDATCFYSDTILQQNTRDLARTESNCERPCKGEIVHLICKSFHRLSLDFCAGRPGVLMGLACLPCRSWENAFCHSWSLVAALKTSRVVAQKCVQTGYF